MYIAAPEAVETVCRSLRAVGKQCFVVGGAVRDALICASSSVQTTERKNDRSDMVQTDWDLATDATPTEIMALFDRVIPTGLAHGTVTILSKGMPLEITTFRTESTYSDARRPDAVSFVSSIEQDLSRRDFTINAMAYDPIDDLLIDPFEGQIDLFNQTIRCVGDPAQRFSEDALRILRAVRFCAQLGFSIEHSTRVAAEEHLDCIKHIARERISDEFRKILFGAHLRNTVRLPIFSRLLEHVFSSLHLALSVQETDSSDVFDVFKIVSDRFEFVLVCFADHINLTNSVGPSSTSSPLPSVAVMRLCLLFSLIKAEGVSIELASMTHDLRLPKRVRAEIDQVLKGLEALRHPLFESPDLQTVIDADQNLQHLLEYRVRQSMSLAGRQLALAPIVIKAALLDDTFTSSAVPSVSRSDSRGRDLISRALRLFSDPKLCLSIAELNVNGRDIASQLGLEGRDIGSMLDRFLDLKLRDPTVSVASLFDSVRVV